MRQGFGNGSRRNSNEWRAWIKEVSKGKIASKLKGHFFLMRQPIHHSNWE
jgi:hypothetical protein